MRKNEFRLVLILLKCDMPFLLQIKCKENQKFTDEMVGIMGFLMENNPFIKLESFALRPNSMYLKKFQLHCSFIISLLYSTS